MLNIYRKDGKILNSPVRTSRIDEARKAVCSDLNFWNKWAHEIQISAVDSNGWMISGIHYIITTVLCGPFILILRTVFLF